MKKLLLHLLSCKTTYVRFNSPMSPTKFLFLLRCGRKQNTSYEHLAITLEFLSSWLESCLLTNNTLPQSIAYKTFCRR